MSKEEIKMEELNKEVAEDWLAENSLEYIAGRYLER